MMNTEEQERIDRFEKLRSELADLDDEALKARFWELCHQVMEPVVELARTHTTPSIERSVLLRMGIDSVTTHAVVENVLNAGLLGKGAGHQGQLLGEDTPRELGLSGLPLQEGDRHLHDASADLVNQLGHVDLEPVAEGLDLPEVHAAQDRGAEDPEARGGVLDAQPQHGVDVKVSSTKTDSGKIIKSCIPLL